MIFNIRCKTDLIGIIFMQIRVKAQITEIKSAAYSEKINKLINC